jgi:hypothetical protein
MEINKSQKKGKRVSGPEWPNSAWSIGEASPGAEARARPSSAAGRPNSEGGSVIMQNGPLRIHKSIRNTILLFI